MKHKSLTTMATGALVALCSMSATAIDISFFAQDRGPGESPPGLASWPNSTAAEASFLSYLVGTGTETFESKTTGSAPGALTFPGAGTATMSGGVVRSGHVGFGRYPISGSQWVETSTSLTIDFSDPVAAFGFYGVDIGDFNGDLTLSFVNGTTKNFTLDTSGMPGGSVMFFGYINDANPFTRVTFGNTASGVDGFGFDNMTIGSVEQVAPPSIPDGGATLGLLGFAVVGLTAVTRKLKQA